MSAANGKKNIVALRTYANDVERAREATTASTQPNEESGLPPKAPNTTEVKPKEPPSLRATLEKEHLVEDESVTDGPADPIYQNEYGEEVVLSDENTEVPPFHSIRASSPEDTSLGGSTHISLDDHALAADTPDKTETDTSPEKDEHAYAPNRIQVADSDILTQTESIHGERGSVHTRDGIFDTEEVLTGSGEGTIVSDKKRGTFKLFPAIFKSIRDWFTEKRTEYKKSHTPKKSIERSSRRKDVIKAATNQSKQAPHGDYERVAKRLKGIERVGSKRELQIKDTEATTPSWSHKIDEPAEESDAQDEAVRSLEEFARDAEPPQETFNEPQTTGVRQGEDDKSRAEASPVTEEVSERVAITPSPAQTLAAATPSEQSTRPEKTLDEPSLDQQQAESLDPQEGYASQKLTDEQQPEEALATQEQDRPQLEKEEEPSLDQQQAESLDPQEGYASQKLTDEQQPEEALATQEQDRPQLEEEEPSLDQQQAESLDPQEGYASQKLTDEQQPEEALATQEQDRPQLEKKGVPEYRRQRVGQPRKEGPQDASLLTLIAVIITAIILGVGTTVWWFTRDSAPVPTTGVNTSEQIVETQATINIPLSGGRDTFLDQLRGSVAGSEGSIVVFTPTTNGTPAGPGRVFDVLALSAPGNMLRSVNTLSLGAASRGNPFIVMRFASFDTVFAGMLQWESAILRDLAPFFGPTTRTTSIDSRINNRDVRVLIDEQGNDRVVYGFVDKNTLLITTDREAYTTIVPAIK